MLHYALQMNAMGLAREERSCSFLPFISHPTLSAPSNGNHNERAFLAHFLRGIVPRQRFHVTLRDNHATFLAET